MRPVAVSVVGLWWLAWTAMASAQVPAVTQTFPAAGDQSVDPAVSELKVTFDRDMGDGFSFTGGGETFPEVTGRPR